MQVTYQSKTMKIHRSNHLPCASGQRCRPKTQCRSFLRGFTKLLGRDQGNQEGVEVGQCSTVDKTLLGSDAGRPVFPPYSVISKTSEYSLRLYSVFPVIEMEYQRREEGYASLGSYIDGKNSEGVCFAYTQPVVMCYYPDARKVMQMFVGPQRVDEGTLRSPQGGEGAVTAVATSLPSPLELSVQVNVSGGELVAVLQFDGYITPASAEAARKRLMGYLQRDGIQLSEADAAGRFRCAQYGAVYQLGDRLNEMMLQVNA